MTNPDSTSWALKVLDGAPDEDAEAVIVSFGYGHSPAPGADLTIDARRHFRNPHHDPRMRELTGLDMAVRHHVMATSGVRSLVSNSASWVRDVIDEASTETSRPVTVAVGCVGGRHRSVAIAEWIAETLRGHGVRVAVAHRDVDKPVIQR
ncbi:RapZ C-terminal domain-containing protein [Nonomuraea sp. NPDC004354]